MAPHFVNYLIIIYMSMSAVYISRLLAQSVMNLNLD